MNGWLLLLLLLAEEGGGAPPPAAAEGAGTGGAAVQLDPFVQGPGTVTPTAGHNGLAVLFPIAEPLSSGSPPVTPTLCRRVSIGYPSRRVPVRSGQLATLALDVIPRPTVRVEWDGLDRAERDALLAWIEDELEGTRFAFDVSLDGPGTPPVTVRAVADAADEWVHKAAYRVSLDAEEVF